LEHLLLFCHFETPVPDFFSGTPAPVFIIFLGTHVPVSYVIFGTYVPVFKTFGTPVLSFWEHRFLFRCSKNVKKDTNNIYQGISSNQKLLQTEINYQELFPLSFVY
jgi:hypothetical protein